MNRKLRAMLGILYKAFSHFHPNNNNDEKQYNALNVVNPFYEMMKSYAKYI